MKKYKNIVGFTLIELLVVIAIIGILSSVILASLNATRSRGQDAKIKAQLAGARNAAELYFDQNTSYNGTAGDIDGTVLDCTTVASMFTDTSSDMAQYTDLNNYPNIGVTTMRCSSTDSTYVMSVSLANTGEFWCVDGLGASELLNAADHITAHPDGATECSP